MPNSDIAIVGLSCVFPQAANVRQFWANLVNGVDAVTELPAKRWHEIDRTAYPPEHDAHLHSMRGGYLASETLFDPLEFGVMPNTVRHGDADQFLLLKVIDEALRDAHVDANDAIREKTDVIVGRGGYPTQKHMELNLRAEVIDVVLQLIEGRFPDLFRDGVRGDVDQYLRSLFTPSEADFLSTSIPNIAASRAANRLNLMGSAFTVDAACASSLLAVEQAVSRLRRHQSDLAVAAGIFLTNTPTFAHVFSRLGAISPTGTIRPFDRRADGLVIGEGAGAAILKRLEDAVRDGNEIYAVIKGVGLSADGRDVDVLAPSSKGQVKALERAYADAGIDPATIGFLEAHGTGTLAGDRTELATIKAFYGTTNEPATQRGMGSVKSMIGHTMPASGMASLIKTALALSNKTLPPSLHCEEPHPELADAPFYLVSETRPWVHANSGPPRRAAINTFGFGGANVHLVLEEAVSTCRAGSRSVVPRNFEAAVHRETELVVFAAQSPADLGAQLLRLRTFLDLDQSERTLADVAHSLSLQIDYELPCRLALVCTDMDHLDSLLEHCSTELAAGRLESLRNDVVYFATQANRVRGKLACMIPGMGFPGLTGSYPDHLMELCLHLPEVREEFDFFEARDRNPLDQVPTSVIFSPPSSLPEEFRKQLKKRLAIPNTNFELPDQSVPQERYLSAMGVMLANWASWRVFEQLGVPVDMLCGQSQGEMAALCAAGACNFHEIAPFYWKTLDVEMQYDKGDGMLFAYLSEEQVAPWLERYPGTHICIHVTPTSLVLGGKSETIQEMAERLREESVLAHPMPYPPIHSPRLSHLREVLTKALTAENAEARTPHTTIYSSINAEPYSGTLEEMRDTFSLNLDHPVRMWQTIRRLYDDGARIFVQVGGGHAAANVKTLLAEESNNVLTAAFDIDTRNPLTQINHMCATLYTAGIPIKFTPLYEHRRVRSLNFDAPQPAPVASRTAVPLRIDWSPLYGNGSHHISKKPADSSDSPASSGEVHSTSTASNGHLPQLEPLVQHEPSLGIGQRCTSCASINEVAAQSGMPLVGRLVSHVPGEEIVLERPLDLDEDLFLVDHCLAESLDIKPAEQCLPTLPMTVSMELMAENAALLCPGMGLVGFEEIRALRWISLRNRRSAPMRIVARLQSVDAETGVRRVQVEVHFDSQLSSACVAVFGTKYSSNSAPLLPRFADDDSWPYTMDDVYYGKQMFHGPLFQCITGLGHFGNPDYSAELTVLPQDQLFQSTSQPVLLTDPVVMDGLGQLFGLWAFAHRWTVFPTRVDKVELFAPTPAAGTRIPVRGEVREFDSELKRIRVDIEAEDGTGNVWIRATGWTDWVFKWPVAFQDWLRMPERNYLAEEVTLPFSPEKSVCAIIPTNSVRGDSIDRVSYMLLRPSELAEFEAIDNPKRQKQFLASRIAAKDAARLWTTRFEGADSIHPAAFCVGHDEAGRPQLFVGDERVGLKLTLAHCDSIAVALVSEVEAGIDIEPVGGNAGEILPHFATDEEIALLQSMCGHNTAETGWPTRLWCAKEAVGKLLGIGLAGKPKDLQALDIDGEGQFLIHHVPTAGRFVVTTVLVGGNIIAYTTFDSAFVTATTAP